MICKEEDIKFMINKTILHLTSMISTKYGGLEHYFFELAQFCNQKGYHTVLQYELLPRSKAYLSDLADIGVDIIVQPINTNPIRSIQGITKLIWSIRPDIIQSHFVNGHALLTTLVIARMLGIQKILHMKHSNPELKKDSLRRFIFNRYDHILAASRSIADNLIQAGVNPKVVSTHYLGLFGKREKSNQLRLQLRKEFKIPNQAVVLACIAFDSPVKGLDILLGAFAKIINNRSQIHLIVVGVDPSLSDLPGQADKLGLTDHVHWAGIRDKGWQILNAADLYVHPSRDEGLGLAIVEAMSLRLPVVATRVGGVPEAVISGETGGLAEPGSVTSLADAIEHMLASQTRWKTIGDAGYRRYQDLFKGEKSVKILVEQYYM